jgi:flagellar hook protein FlgE
VGGNDQWAYSASIPDADTATGAAGSGILGAGTLEFDAAGTLLTPAANVAFTTPAFANGAGALTFDWDLYDDNNVAIITGYPIPSTTSATNTDGYPPGNLSSVIIDSDGIIEGVFSNGQVEQMAQLAIAQFNNPKGLMRLGQNLFGETMASGNSSIGVANTGGRGTIIGSALESSNVDMATEFTRMLVFQRGYQANSKTITTADTLTQTALTLVR